MTAKRRKNPHSGSTVDDWLAEEGVLEEFRAIAIKEVIAWQIGQEMKKKKLSATIQATLRRPPGRQARSLRRRSQRQ